MVIRPLALTSLSQENLNWQLTIINELHEVISRFHVRLGRNDFCVFVLRVHFSMRLIIGSMNILTKEIIMKSICLKRFDVSKPGSFISNYSHMINSVKLTSRKALISTTARLVRALKEAEYQLFLVSKEMPSSVMDWLKKRRIIRILREGVRRKQQNLYEWVRKSISFYSAKEIV